MTALLLTALLLGVVEGLTEFIPVSSTGHLILSGHLLGFTGDRAAPFTVFIQLGAILAVMWETRGSLFSFATDLGRGGSGRRMAVNLSLAFFPSAFLGLAFHDLIERELFSPVFVAWGLLAGGMGILAVEHGRPATRVSGLVAVTWGSALAVGLSQCLSLFPGISRSAATIMGGMVAGMDRRTATEFSFLLAIPTMIGAGFYDLYHWRHILSASDIPIFSAGFLTAFVSGLMAVRFLLRYVSRHDFRPFAWYRFAVAAAVFWIVWRG
jgi:undecaprenyl-diphosphatase